MRAREAKLDTQLFDGPAGPASELGLDRIFPVDGQRLQRLGDLRRGARAAAPVRPLAAARRADDDPGGVGEPRRDGPGPPGLLPVPLLDHGAVGRPGRASRSPTARSSAPSSTATACAPAAGGRPRTTWSCWPARSASSTSRPPTSSPRAGCSRAGCSSSTPPPGGSSPTRRSRARWPPSSPYERLAARRPGAPALAAGAPPRAAQPRVRRPPADALRLHRGGAARSWSRRWPSTGAEPIGSMGTDTPVAALSDRSRLLYDYFGQLFAQVTNPPLDAIREELVTSLGRTFGPEQNLLQAAPGVLPAGVPAVPGDRQRRARQDPAHRRRRRPARLRRRADHRPLRRQRRRPGARPRRSSSCGPRSPRRSRPAPGSSCCPTATATRSARRSRRC